MAERVQLDEHLRAQGGVDPLLEFLRITNGGPQPLDQVALELLVLGLVGQRNRDRDSPLRRQLRQHVLFAPADVAAAAQVPMEPPARLLAAEAARKRRGGPELVESPQRAKLRHELGRAVDERRAGQSQAQGVRSEPLAEVDQRLRAPGLRVLAVVRLVEHERLGLELGEHVSMCIEHVVVDDHDVGPGGRARAARDRRGGPSRQPARRLAQPVELE